MKRCNTEIRDLGGWISCDADTCTTRTYQYLGSGEYAWVTTKVESCAGLPIPVSDARVPPADTRTPAALILLLVIVLAARYLANRDARELRDAYEREQREKRRDLDLRAECAIAKSRRFSELMRDNPSAAIQLAKASARKRNGRKPS